MDHTIKRTLYKSSRYLIEFFMYNPKVEEYKNNYQISYNPILTIRQMNSKSFQEDYSTIKERSFRITPRNYYKTLKFFNSVVNWFYDEKMEDLFVYNDDNELVFNSDYNSLYLVTNKGINEQSQMRAIPTLVAFNEKKYEGIHLYINSQTNVIILTKDEVEMIFGFLKDFSFQSEVMSSMLIIDSARTNNNISRNSTNYSSGKTPFD